MSKLFWSKEEWELLRSESVRLLAETPYLRRDQVLARAQLVLPEARRRAVTHSVVFRYKSFLEECRALAKERPPQPPKVAEATVAPPEPLAGALDALLDALADKLVERMAARLQLQVQTTTHTVTRHNPQPPSATPAVPARPSVLIVGLLGTQCHVIKNSLSHRLEITCLTSEEANSRPVLHKEHTVLMTKFINHAVQNKYRRHPNLRLCNGGVTELSRMLQELDSCAG